jgi:hypothetical protein
MHLLTFMVYRGNNFTTHCFFQCMPMQEHCGMDLTDLKALRRAAAARSNALETNARLAAAVPPFEAVSPAWRACGFSSEDPALEFRGTGLLGMFYVRHYT